MRCLARTTELIRDIQERLDRSIALISALVSILSTLQQSLFLISNHFILIISFYAQDFRYSITPSRLSISLIFFCFCRTLYRSLLIEILLLLVRRYCSCRHNRSILRMINFSLYLSQRRKRNERSNCRIGILSFI